MVYPTLLAAIADVADPAWRGSAIGVYRLWRDLGFAIGALVAGVIADALGMPAAIGAVAALTAALRPRGARPDARDARQKVTTLSAPASTRRAVPSTSDRSLGEVGIGEATGVHARAAGAHLDPAAREPLQHPADVVVALGRRLARLGAGRLARFGSDFLSRSRRKWLRSIPARRNRMPLFMDATTCPQ